MSEEQRSWPRAKINQRVNILNLIASIAVFGTGLVLAFKFYVDDGVSRREWLGLSKYIWLTVHQIWAIAFLSGYAIHLMLHWKYMKTVAGRWRAGLPKKLKKRSREQVLLLTASVIVILAGFWPWLAMPGATLDMEAYHCWISIHSWVGLFLIAGVILHSARRWPQMFGPAKAAAAATGLGAYPVPDDVPQTGGKRSRSRRSKRHSTRYIRIDTAKCRACWECIPECKNRVLGKMDIWFHKHAVIVHPENCTGCRQCVAVCPNGAIEPVERD